MGKLKRVKSQLLALGTACVCYGLVLLIMGGVDEGHRGGFAPMAFISTGCISMLCGIYGVCFAKSPSRQTFTGLVGVTAFALVAGIVQTIILVSYYSLYWEIVVAFVLEFIIVVLLYMYPRKELIKSINRPLLEGQPKPRHGHQYPPQHAHPQQPPSQQVPSQQYQYNYAQQQQQYIPPTQYPAEQQQQGYYPPPQPGQQGYYPPPQPGQQGYYPPPQTGQQGYIAIQQHPGQHPAPPEVMQAQPAAVYQPPGQYAKEPQI